MVFYASLKKKGNILPSCMFLVLESDRITEMSGKQKPDLCHLPLEFTEFRLILKKCL